MKSIPLPATEPAADINYSVGLPYLSDLLARATIIVLSDRGVTKDKIAIPALLACAGVHHHPAEPQHGGAICRYADRVGNRVGTPGGRRAGTRGRTASPPRPPGAPPAC